MVLSRTHWWGLVFIAIYAMSCQRVCECPERGCIPKRVTISRGTKVLQTIDATLDDANQVLAYTYTDSNGVLSAQRSTFSYFSGLLSQSVHTDGRNTNTIDYSYLGGSGKVGYAIEVLRTIASTPSGDTTTFTFEYEGSGTNLVRASAIRTATGYTDSSVFLGFDQGRPTAIQLFSRDSRRDTVRRNNLLSYTYDGMRNRTAVKARFANGSVDNLTQRITFSPYKRPRWQFFQLKPLGITRDFSPEAKDEDANLASVEEYFDLSGGTSDLSAKVVRDLIVLDANNCPQSYRERVYTKEAGLNGVPVSTLTYRFFY